MRLPVNETCQPKALEFWMNESFLFPLKHLGLFDQECGHLIADHVLHGAFRVGGFACFDLAVELGHGQHLRCELNQYFRDDLGLWTVFSFGKGLQGGVYLGG